MAYVLTLPYRVGTPKNFPTALVRHILGANSLTVYHGGLVCLLWGSWMMNSRVRPTIISKEGWAACVCTRELLFEDGLLVALDQASICG